MWITELICITTIVCFIVDVSGVVDNLKVTLFKFMHGTKIPYRDYSFKPVDCSLYMTFWCCNFWLLCQGTFNLYTLCATCLLALSSEVITYFLFFLRDLLGWFINKLNDLIND
ncbi:MAG: hypothetical protein LUE93_13375 [Bacteroides sp.]|nr:hypothetical protein [Bacteroides sp.]